MQLWGGIECTLNRVGNTRFDQLERSGHYARASDLDLIAGLGIRTLRYPLLWERAVTTSPAEFDWSFADDRLPRLRELGITPIAGLVHHGCGPLHTSLLADDFAAGLAAYAGKLAQRFPWLESYTPVNEPLTTARFSGLYGHWHPHERTGRAFARILMNECRATVLAMRAVRAVNSSAQLVQTDDLGTIYSTSHLSYQAEFENQRRWLAWDLLCGMVDVAHPMYRHLLAWGIPADEIEWLCDNPCPPQVIGIDHYVTSDRFLDEDFSRYPSAYWGGNAREAYADIDAVRVLERPGTSRRRVILEAARRYAIPLALTEVHIGCTEDEQARWLQEAWTTSAELAATGIDIRAVTAWALLGSYDWDSLLTSGGGTYEPGAFCLGTGEPRPTALAKLIATLAGAQASPGRIPAPVGIGWWRRPERLLYARHRPERQEERIAPYLGGATVC